jgi:Arc/MetJ-type ribon-helix-helix transcriptional regulator
MMRVSVKILEIIDRLVEVGRYTCRSEFIRTAVRKLIDEELAKEGMWRELRKRRRIRVKVID